MKLDKHRQRYFADLAVKTTLNKRGRKVYAYVYQGIWYRWGAEGFDFNKRRLLQPSSIAQHSLQEERTE